jgi:hypothetical protein
MPQVKSSAKRRRKEALRRRRRQERRTTRTGEDKGSVDSAVFEEMVAEIRREGILPVTEVTINPPGETKMSQVLEELIAPYLEETHTLDEFKNLVLLGRLAWNAALLPAEERDVFLKQVRNTLPRALRADIGHLLKSLILRKFTLFPNDRRYIISIHVTDLGAQYHLAVAYSTPAEAT